LTHKSKTEQGKITAGFFDTYADDFDSIYGSGKNLIHRLLTRYLRKSIRRRFEMTLEACVEIIGKKVLDVGCGPGHYAISLALNGGNLSWLT